MENSRLDCFLTTSSRSQFPHFETWPSIFWPLWDTTTERKGNKNKARRLISLVYIDKWFPAFNAWHFSLATSGRLTGFHFSVSNLHKVLCFGKLTKNARGEYHRMDRTEMQVTIYCFWAQLRSSSFFSPFRSRRMLKSDLRTKSGFQMDSNVLGIRAWEIKSDPTACQVWKREIASADEGNGMQFKISTKAKANSSEITNVVS